MSLAVLNGIIFRQLLDADSSTYTFLLACPHTYEAILIDTVYEQVGLWVCEGSPAHMRPNGAWLNIHVGVNMQRALYLSLLKLQVSCSNLWPSLVA